MSDARSPFRLDLLKGRVALVTGGGTGICHGIAQELGRHGARLMLMGRRPDVLEEAAGKLRSAGVDARSVAGDVRDPEACAKAVAETVAAYGRLDTLVNGAAGNFLCPTEKLSPNGFRTVIDIDLNGTFNIFRAAYALLRKPGASLIAISAGQATNPMMFQAHVCAAKAGINMLVKVLAMEWGPAGVRVNVISPGPIGGTEGMARLTPTTEGEASWKARIALRDFGQKSDVSDMAMFLASDASAYVTGSIFQCDGGWTLGDSSGEAPGIETR